MCEKKNVLGGRDSVNKVGFHKSSYMKTEYRYQKIQIE